MEQELKQAADRQRAGPSDASVSRNVSYDTADAVIRANEIVGSDEKSKGYLMITKKPEEFENNNDARTTDGEEKISASSDHVIDMKCVVSENQKLCRICHLSEKEISVKNLMVLMEIGCGCKGELGVAHSYCAEAWFRVKGNRLCEICGETAKNIKGIVDNRFMEEWNEGISSGDGNNMSSSTSNSSTRRCLSRQPLCNFLMACLVIAFILPWFFRANMF